MVNWLGITVGALAAVVVAAPLAVLTVLALGVVAGVEPDGDDVGVGDGVQPPTVSPASIAVSTYFMVDDGGCKGLKTFKLSTTEPIIAIAFNTAYPFSKPPYPKPENKAPKKFWMIITVCLYQVVKKSVTLLFVIIRLDLI